jgi:hypothetical protein
MGQGDEEKARVEQAYKKYANGITLHESIALTSQEKVAEIAFGISSLDKLNVCSICG